MKGKHEHTQHRLGDRMEQSTLSGQPVGIPEDEVPEVRGGLSQLPPSGTTPSTQLDEGGEWLVVSKRGQLEWEVDLFLTLEGAQQYFWLISPRWTCYLTHVLNKDL